MKKTIQKISKREIAIGIFCILVGMLITYLLIGNDVKSQKKLTSRILTNAVQSMEASQSLAESCSEAYNTATACVSNLSTCNTQEETKKLDAFNIKKEQADKKIKVANEELGSIIEEVSNAK